ncbi:MAG: V-type ATP synthase subunit F [Promethearchaeota archaeon]
MTRIITIGSEIFVTGFKLQGIDGFIATPGDVPKLVKLVKNDDTISIVFIEEELYNMNKELLENIKISSNKPLFVEIPLTPEQEKTDIIAELIKKDIGIKLD